MMHVRMFLLAVILGLVGVAFGLTLLDEALEGLATPLPSEMLDFIDRLIMIGSAVASTILIMHISRLRERTDDLEGTVRQAAKEGRAWRAQSRRFIEGLSRAVDAQFELWGLTPAEADVAGLLLKGASLREIANLRRTSEATIRQQSQNIYRKSGLGSRSELSAYFMEDLFTLSEATLAGTQRGEESYDA